MPSELQRSVTKFIIHSQIFKHYMQRSLGPLRLQIFILCLDSFIIIIFLRIYVLSYFQLEQLGLYNFYFNND